MAQAVSSKVEQLGAMHEAAPAPGTPMMVIDIDSSPEKDTGCKANAQDGLDAPTAAEPTNGSTEAQMERVRSIQILSAAEAIKRVKLETQDSLFACSLSLSERRAASLGIL